MTNQQNSSLPRDIENNAKQPHFNIHKIGIVARNYNTINDFSNLLPQILKELDNEGCDAALFSLYTIVPRDDLRDAFKELKNIKAVFLEKFRFGVSGQKIEGHFMDSSPTAEGYFVYYHTSSGWQKYHFYQEFGSRRRDRHGKKTDVGKFIKQEFPKRFLGNCCILLCGETNGVTYSQSKKKVDDKFKLRKAIPENVKIILNPIHDRMTRHEMPKKRNFLSANNRWVISVWNKGKRDKNGKVKNETGPAWDIYHNGKQYPKPIDILQRDGVEIGILDIGKA